LSTLFRTLERWKTREEKWIKGSIELAIEKKKETAKDKKKRKVPIEPDDQVEYRATKRKKKMEKGAKKKQQLTIRGESDNDDNMMITELAKSKSKSGKELSVCNVAKGEKTKATKATLCRKPSRYVPYKGTFVPYDGTFGASDQGQPLDV
jgi:hypothetical protein